MVGLRKGFMLRPKVERCEDNVWEKMDGASAVLMFLVCRVSR